MYAAAQAKPQSIEVEHLGPSQFLGPILSPPTSRVARSMPRVIWMTRAIRFRPEPCVSTASFQMDADRSLPSPRRNVRVRGGIQPLFLRRAITETTPGRLRAPKEITWQLCVRWGLRQGDTRKSTTFQSALAL